jgi:hypothetical protein
MTVFAVTLTSFPASLDGFKGCRIIESVSGQRFAMVLNRPLTNPEDSSVLSSPAKATASDVATPGGISGL